MSTTFPEPLSLRVALGISTSPSSTSPSRYLFTLGNFFLVPACALVVYIGVTKRAAAESFSPAAAAPHPMTFAQ